MEIIRAILGFPIYVAGEVVSAILMTVEAAIFVAIFTGVCWIIDRVTRRPRLALERSQWWVNRFGYRRTAWEVIIPGVMLILFLSMLAFVFVRILAGY